MDLGSLNREICRPVIGVTLILKKISQQVNGDSLPPLTPSAALRLPAVNRWLERLHPGSLVEAGCGMGAMACRFAERFDYWGYEPDRSSFNVAESRLNALGHGHLVNGSLPQEPDRKFDVLVALEVLEHIEDDLAVLDTWRRWVVPGGHILLSVPAHPQRFGPCDRLVGHCRRYSRRSLEDVMTKAGLSEIEIDSWGMPAGYVLEWVRNFRAKRHPADDKVGTGGSGRLHQPTDRIGGLVELAARPMAALQTPFRRTELGVGYIAVGRVPDDS